MKPFANASANGAAYRQKILYAVRESQSTRLLLGDDRIYVSSEYMSVHSAVSAVGKSEAHKLWKLHLILWIRWRGFTMQKKKVFQ